MSKFLNYDVFMSLKIGFTLANSADPDEMQPYAAFYLDLQFAKVPVYWSPEQEGPGLLT